MQYFSFIDEDIQEYKMIIFQNMVKKTKSSFVKRGHNVYIHKQQKQMILEESIKQNNKVYYNTVTLELKEIVLRQDKIIENYF